MKRAYLVTYTEGNFGDKSYIDVFITFDKQKAIDWINKFNRILSKWKKMFDENEMYDIDYDTTIKDIIYFRDVQFAFYKEIEIR